MHGPRILVCLVLAAVALSATADQDSVRRGVRSGAMKPLAEILAGVEARHGARVLDVELETGDGRSWYEITLLHKDGHRVEINVDPASGAEIDPRSAGPALRPMAEVLRRVAERHPGTVRHAELERRSGEPPVYEITVERADGSEQRVLVDARDGRIVEQAQRPGRLPAGVRPLPVLVESVERRYGGRAVEIEIKYDGRRGAYYEIELQLPGGRGLEVDVDPVSAQVLREES
ncbi:PepSY domain-containing protein [Rubrivivax gelatinosus]|uniref:Putative membrane protein YkoI n=1 Tax=Rubrivivax gelatinosus TaxID=28068 RepID=A0A4R2LXS5_RUBGE|nr:PepSY domain-containing protein [Rubrivivax gelatinosus]MBK1689847.1 hypothetical protein [Rubrivivax gelatinosus]TCO97144.1 putative membrane protein YkoI [Rubrivivax gelatinosus]